MLTGASAAQWSIVKLLSAKYFVASLLQLWPLTVTSEYNIIQDNLYQWWEIPVA